MTTVETRVQEIGRKYAHLAQDIVVLSLTEETFCLILVLNDDTPLRATERHHRELENFPHHKHIGEKGSRVASYETSLDDVMAFIAKEMKG